ncbi:FAD-binding oxidoreductase [Mycolicibacterium bacteremicum]|uniref:NAD(P)/FAD-dependent oxidoreductase n=1 Tax=Mycolicibacterium bacteremicum TaxID=564198 RepID=UPI0026EBB453|nr:FAD-dependent oxidoreductase [Mycolicibacterium bacteremicum]
MVGVDRIDGGPRHVVVVGAGIVGLSTAWFLQERGVHVTVVDRTGVAAGASWGNAGWLSPALTIPLNQPAVLRYGLKSLFNPAAPLHIPLRADLGLARFLATFARHCTTASAERAVRANQPFNAECLEAFEVLSGNGVDVPVTESAITALFETAAQAEELRAEITALQRAGLTVEISELRGADLREAVPLTSGVATVAVAVGRQRYIDPGRFVTALGRAVVERGADLMIDRVIDVTPQGSRVTVRGAGGADHSADAVVIATGAWLNELTEPWVRVPVRAGRGYSFTVPIDRPMPGPIYLPAERVACTPYQGAMRVAGTMEFREPEAPIAGARVRSIIRSAARLLDGVRWDEARDVWVGPRPVSADGLPVIGQVGPSVYVAGGHGMWGLAHGPVTGRMLTEQITTGKKPEALRAFDPSR